MQGRLAGGQPALWLDGPDIGAIPGLVTGGVPAIELAGDGLRAPDRARWVSQNPFLAWSRSVRVEICEIDATYLGGCLAIDGEQYFVVRA